MSLYLDTLSVSPAVEPFTFTMDGLDEETDELGIQTPLSPAPGDRSANTSAPSFESILSGKSIAPFSRIAFLDFLRKIHCSENLEFLMTADSYLTTLNDPSTRKHIWHYIYTNYISTYALKEVNIPHDTRSKLTDYFETDTLPKDCDIVECMMIIKELLRDAYFQFIQHAKRQSLSERFFSEYSILPSPSDEDIPRSHGRRTSEHPCPLDLNAPVSERSISPIEVTEVIDVRPREVPRSTDTDESSGEEYRDKKNSLSSNKSISTKNSSFSEGYGLKKLAGKFKWRRMSSNSSTGTHQL